MSEFLAEAAVLIRPDTTKFRATLIAELEAATKGLVVPIPVAAVAGASNVATAAQSATVSAKEATVATNELTASRQRQATVDAAAAAEEANLAQAQRLTAAAQAKLALIDQAGARATTELTAARAELRAANTAVLAGERAVDAALITTSAETQAAAVETLRLAVAQRAVASAAELEAVALKGSSRAAAEAAATQAKLAQGAEATVLSLFGIRGATLAASKSFLLGAAGVTILAKSVHEASAEQEAAARAEKIFGDQTRQLEEDARSFADTLGLSTTETLKFEAAVGTALQTAGVSQDQIGGLSEQLVKLAANLAAANNVPIDETLRALKLFIVGNARGLKALNIELTATAVNQEALRESGKKFSTELTDQERKLARITLLLRETGNQSGAAADRQGSLAQKTRELNANLANLSASIGSLVVGPLATLASEISTTVSGIEKLIAVAKKTAPATTDASGHMTAFGKAMHFLGDSAKTAAFILPELIKQFSTTGDAAQTTDLKVRGLTDDIKGSFLQAIAQAQAAANALTFKHIRDEVAATNLSIIGLQEHLLDLQFTGGSQISTLQAIVAKNQEIIRQSTVKGSGITHDQVIAARQARNAAQAQIDSINAQAAADAKTARDKAASDAQKAVDARNKAAQAAQDKLDAADQNFLDQVTFRRNALDIKLADAQASKGLQDDIRVQHAITTELIADRAAAALRIHNTKLRTETVQALTAAIHDSRNAEKALAAEEKQAANELRKTLDDRAAQRLDLSIQIAQVNKNVNQEIALRQARIKADRIRIKNVHGDLVLRKQLQLEIAQDTAAIKELKKAQDDNNKASASLAFSFLQSQQGFAANLLSNLLPVGAVAGTVGGTHGAISTPTSDIGGPQRPPDVGAHLGAASQTAGGPAGPTNGQLGVLIDIQRQQLRVLQRFLARTGHPEAVAHKAAAAAVMDISFW